MKIKKTFVADECGAITVDWTVLTAAIIVATLTAYWTIGTGTEDLATSIKADIDQASF